MVVNKMHLVHIQVNLSVKVVALNMVSLVAIQNRENVVLIVPQITAAGVGHLDLIHKILMLIADVVMIAALLQC